MSKGHFNIGQIIQDGDCKIEVVSFDVNSDEYYNCFLVSEDGTIGTIKLSNTYLKNAPNNLKT